MRVPRLRMRRPRRGVFAVITTIEGRQRPRASADRAALLSPESRVGKTRQDA